MFYGLDEKNPNRYHVYLALIRLATQGDLLYLVHPNLDDVSRFEKYDVISLPCLYTLVDFLDYNVSGVSL